MKKVCVLFAFAMLLSVNLDAKKIMGKIILSNDTIVAPLIIPYRFFSFEPSFVKLQSKVVYIDEYGKRITVHPEDAREFQFTYQSVTVRMVSRFNSIGLGSPFSSSYNIFLEQLIDGDVKLFNYYYTVDTGGTYNPATGGSTAGIPMVEEEYIIQKGDGGLMKPRRLSFRKDMTEFFSDCPELSERIENKEYRFNDLVSIIRFYNSECR